jgi:preprotein translocase subunit YajC
MPLLLAQEGAPASPTAQPAPSPGDGLFSMLPLMIGVMLIWWFLVLRPQSKAEKARRAKLAAIQKGDRVRTRGGIEGIVARVQDDRVTLKIDTEGKVHVQMTKAYIEDVLTEEPAAAAEDKK